MKRTEKRFNGLRKGIILLITVFLLFNCYVSLYQTEIRDKVEIRKSGDSDRLDNYRKFSSDHYKDHDIISINGNDDFATQANEEGWIGDGTTTNPYIISDLHISGSGNLLFIENTNVHFKIVECFVTGGTTGIKLSSVSNGQIVNSTIANNDRSGIDLGLANNNLITNNSIINNNFAGIDLYSCTGNKIKDNNLIDNGIYISGTDWSHYVQSEVSGNVINGKSLIYWSNVEGKTVPANAGQIILFKCSTIEITQQTLSRATVGLMAINCMDLNFNNNIVVNNSWSGVYLYYSDCSTLFNNTITNNDNGIKIRSSRDNRLQNNFVADNNDDGIYLIHSDECIIENNIFVTNKKYGVYTSSSSAEVTLGNQVTKNNFIANNLEGTSQALNSGNNEYSSNYWDEWTSPDENDDGIVDVPYLTDGSQTKDLFPQTKPYPSPFLSMITVSYPRTITYTQTVTTRTSPCWTFLLLVCPFIGIFLIRKRKRTVVLNHR